MIPKILHQIWLGPKEPPRAWMETWRRMHPGWGYHLWREDNLPADLPGLELLPRAVNFAGQSDILRYALLERFGGVYVDADSICLKPLDDLLDVEFFACWENERVRPGLVANGFLGSQPGHPLMKKLVGALDPGFPSWKRTGPLYLTETVRGKPGVTIYPSRYFLPVHHTENVLSEQIARAASIGHLQRSSLRGPLRRRIGDSYAVHFWGTLRGYHHVREEAAGVAQRQRVVAVTENLLPAEWGGEKSLLKILEHLATEHDVSAVYRRLEPPPEQDGPVQFVFQPALSLEGLRAMLVEMAPDLLIVARHYWTALADLPIRKLAYVCYWTGLVSDPPRLETGKVEPLPAVEELKRYDGVLANSRFTREVLRGLGIEPERIIVCNPTCDWPEPQEEGRELVLAVGKEKHRQEILDALRPTVLDYDSKRPTRRTDDMGSYYDRAAVVVHPTYLSESYCRVAVEAMWHGCPLVYTALGNLPELIGDTAGIALAHDATPEQWAAAVARAKEEPWRGEAGRRRAGVIRRYHAARPALTKAIRRMKRDRKPWEIWLAVPDYPGVATAAEHLAELHGLKTTAGRLPEQWDTLILGSVRPDWLAALPELGRRGRVCLWWHSDLAQSGTTKTEIARLEEAMHAVERGHLWAILPTSESLTAVLRARGVRAHWLPNVIGRIEPRTKYTRTDRAQVGIFTGAHWRKNHLTTIAASALSGATVRCSAPIERAYGRVMDLLGVARSVDDAADKAALYDLVTALTVTPVLSHAETYCYQAAESIFCGTPVIASPTVPVMQGLDSELSILPDPNDSSELARRIRRLHEDRETRAELVERQRLHLHEVNFRHKEISYRTLVEVLDG